MLQAEEWRDQPMQWAWDMREASTKQRLEGWSEWDGVRGGVR